MPFPFLRKRLDVEVALAETSMPHHPVAPVPECPSFDDEPWKSEAERLRPKVLDEYILLKPGDPTPPPVPVGHPYVQLLLRFLDTVPGECWLDEENEAD